MATFELSSFELATLLIALHGAILSTILAIYTYLSDNRRLKVTFSFVVAGDGITKPQTYLCLSCANIGKRPINLVSYGILLPIQQPDGNKIFFKNQSPDSIPKTLKDGDGCNLYAEPNGIGRLLAGMGIKSPIEVRGYFVDATDKRYYSNKYKLDPKHLQKIGVD